MISYYNPDIVYSGDKSTIITPPPTFRNGKSLKYGFTPRWLGVIDKKATYEDLPNADWCRTSS